MMSLSDVNTLAHASVSIRFLPPSLVIFLLGSFCGQSKRLSEFLPLKAAGQDACLLT